MKKRKKHSFPLFFLPMILCLVMVVYLAIAVFRTNPPYGRKSLAAAILAMFAWVVLFAVSQKTKKWTIDIPLIPYFIVTALLCFYACYTVWGSGYLSLAPYESIGYGAQHKDTLFHSAIAESYKRSFIPSNLLNDETRIYYHTFSHFLMAGISGLLNMPAFIAYNFLYPVIFIPLYFFAQLCAVAAAKKYFSEKQEMTLFDLVYILLFNCGVMYTDLIKYNGAGKTAYLVSESFLISNTVLLFSLAICFHVLELQKNGHSSFPLFVWVVIPAELFFMSWAKLSVGVIFLVGIGYYLIRTGFRNYRVWMALLLYGLIMTGCLWMFKGFNIFSSLNPFKGSGGSDAVRIANNQTVFSPLSYDLFCSGKLGIWGHVLFVSAPLFLFAFCEFCQDKKDGSGKREKEKIWIETGTVCLVTGLIPVLFLHIAGGSAGYFSSVVPLVMMIIICGHHYFDLEGISNESLKKKISLIGFSMAALTAFFNIPANSPLEYITNETGSGLIEHIGEIRSLTQGHPGDYTVYMDQDAYPAHLFRKNNGSMFVYPAFTGVGVINASYRAEDGLFYAYCGVETVNYGSTAVSHGKLDLEQALERAKENGKKYVIHVMKNKYQVIDLETKTEMISRKIQERVRFLRINNCEQYTYNNRAAQKKENGMVELLSQGKLQSPVYSFSSGKYQVVFLGNNLDVCEYSIYDSPSIPAGMTMREVEKDADKVVYHVQVEKDVSVNVQFEVTNPAGDRIAMLRQIIVGKILK